MRRLISGLSLFGYLAFIGLQAAHFHPSTSIENCHVCVLGAQAVRHAPAAAPKIVSPVRWTRLSDLPSSKPLVPARVETSARAPPLS